MQPLEIIVAALLWIAVHALMAPTSSRYDFEPPRAKANEDLDTLANSITLYDAQNPPLKGRSFQPLLGRYLQEIPRDPWGRDYALYADSGAIVCFGADGKPGGEDLDEDIVVRYRPAAQASKPATSPRASSTASP